MLLASRQPGSLIVNATGAGKDLPGSPVSGQAKFPKDAVAWDFNYRGDLLFLDYAAAQGTRAINGWDYFLHGWSRIMAEVYGFALTPSLFAEMKRIASP